MKKLSPFIPSRRFPSLEECDEDGLLAVGGDLSHESLIDAYAHGIFPWPVDERSPMLWWSPDPRGIIELEQAHFSRRLLRTCRSGKFTVTFDADFVQVIRKCAAAHDSTWVTQQMIDSYTRLHETGPAHSVEVWHGTQLVGGVYGVSIRGLFAAESMFHTMTDASKVALFFLVERLRHQGFRLLDIQMVTPHTKQFGAMEISRHEYLSRLDKALAHDCQFHP
ncbi:MAG: leucyl/phenylalanyl-tRNA--protein transferase [Planctomycetaceae bacterium]|nr:leucyl/phenylalanyl-tRNA--protein transferase [Planctomycetaceae bacterium]